MAVDPLLLYRFAADVLECVRLEVAATAITGAPGSGIPDGMRVCVVPAPIAQDDCCRGQLSVAVLRTFSSTAFPIEETGRVKCGTALTVIELQIAILRCAPLGDGMDPPTCDQLDDAARLQLVDGYAVRRALWCCMASARDRVIGATNYSINGDCMGSVTTFTVGVGDGCQCP